MSEDIYGEKDAEESDNEGGTDNSDSTEDSDSELDSGTDDELDKLEANKKSSAMEVGRGRDGKASVNSKSLSLKSKTRIDSATGGEFGTKTHKTHHHKHHKSKAWTKLKSSFQNKNPDTE